LVVGSVSIASSPFQSATMHKPAPETYPSEDCESEQIKSLRERYHISQAVLATVLNTSLSTIQKWEIGEKHPGGPSLKLLNILDRKVWKQ
jgi:DNA-binding transcriptional regulator YiaG